MKKVTFISSSGGHLSEILQLEPMFKKYDFNIITEKTLSTKNLTNRFPKKVYYLNFCTRRHFFSYIIKGTINVVKSFYLYFKIKPQYIVTTGVHTAVPFCYIGKLFGSKIIYIETFANSESKTLTGKLIYPIANLFIVQWKSMLKLYPKAIYGGWIY